MNMYRGIPWFIYTLVVNQHPDDETLQCIAFAELNHEMHSIAEYNLTDKTRVIAAAEWHVRRLIDKAIQQGYLPDNTRSN